MKTCTKCSLSKPLDSFYRRGDSGALPYGACKACYSKLRKLARRLDPHRFLLYQRRHREKNREKLRAKSMEYSSVNKEAISVRRKKWAAQNQDRVRARSREYRKRLRDLVFSHYGGPTCVCCGEKEKAFLTIDHINGDGAKHRRENRDIRNWLGIDGWLRRNNYPPGFQVLCYNCNCGKRLSICCPHEIARQRTLTARQAG